LRPAIYRIFGRQKKAPAWGACLVTPENTNWGRGLAPHAAPSNARRFSLPDTSETNRAHWRETVSASRPDASGDTAPPSLDTARAESLRAPPDLIDDFPPAGNGFSIRKPNRFKP